MVPGKDQRGPWRGRSGTEKTRENQEEKKNYEARKKLPKMCTAIIDGRHSGRAPFREVHSCGGGSPVFTKFSRGEKGPKSRPPSERGRLFGRLLGPSGAARAPRGESKEDPRVEKTGFLRRRKGRLRKVLFSKNNSFTSVKSVVLGCSFPKMASRTNTKRPQVT